MLDVTPLDCTSISRMLLWDELAGYQLTLALHNPYLA